MKNETKLLIYRIVSISIFVTIITLASNTKNYTLILLMFSIFILLSAIINIKFKKDIGITADERDWKISGKAAFLTIRIYALPAAILGSLFVLFKEEPFIQNNNLYTIGLVLSLSTCAILLLYSVIFRILREKGE